MMPIALAFSKARLKISMIIWILLQILRVWIKLSSFKPESLRPTLANVIFCLRNILISFAFIPNEVKMWQQTRWTETRAVRYTVFVLVGL